LILFSLRIASSAFRVASCRTERRNDFLEESMVRISKWTQTFVQDESGAALAEYGILVAFIAIVAITAVTFFGSKISAKFSEYATTLG
jgi:pilus assembly protein Flp/PilA